MLRTCIPYIDPLYPICVFYIPYILIISLTQYRFAARLSGSQGSWFSATLGDTALHARRDISLQPQPSPDILVTLRSFCREEK